MKKIKTGIFGLNALLDGGFNEDSAIVVIGHAGAGKTTFALQFIKRGLEEGKEGIFVSLDESKSQIVQEAVEMGWEEILDYMDDEKLVFIDATGRDFSAFIKDEMPRFAEKWANANARIAIDPLTPVIWAVESLYEQRDMLSTLLKLAKKIGTVVCTLEEHGGSDLSGPETIIPMYLADCVIHLRYVRTPRREVIRQIEIVKCRNSRHSELPHPYLITKGLGLLVRRSSTEPKSTGKIDEKRFLALKRQLPPNIIQRIEKFLPSSEEELKGFTINELIEDIINEYGQ